MSVVKTGRGNVHGWGEEEKRRRKEQRFNFIKTKWTWSVKQEIMIVNSIWFSHLSFFSYILLCCVVLCFNQRKERRKEGKNEGWMREWGKAACDKLMEHHHHFLPPNTNTNRISYSFWFSFWFSISFSILHFPFPISHSKWE